MDEHQEFIPISYFQPLSQGNSQLHPDPMQSIQHQPNSGIPPLRTQVQYDSNWAQNESIRKTLEIESGKHNETRSELNVFRTQCFMLEQLIALERAQRISLQNIIQDLRTKCQESAMSRMAAETRMQELQNSRIGSAGHLNNPHRDTPISDYKSATFSPSLPSPRDLNRRKREFPQDSTTTNSKRVRTRPPTIDLSSPLTPTAMTVDSSE